MAGPSSVKDAAQADAGAFSLGEILALALAGISEGPAQIVDDCDAQFAAALEFTRQAASILDRPFSQVWEALTYVPDNMLVMLESPDGWAFLAGYLASAMGAELRADYCPTMH